MANKANSLKFLNRLYIYTLFIIFGGIVLHAPLSVWLGTVFPDYSLIIKSWKEVLMGVAGLTMLYILFRRKQLRILKNPIVITVLIYALLHLLTILIFARGLTSSGAGLLIDLRYLLFFVLVYVAVKLYPDFKQKFMIVGVGGAGIVILFAILQIFILPIDFLTYLGYSKATIMPYLTIDQSHDFIRISSTLRGPNPLGAYCVIVLSVLLTWLLRRKESLSNKKLTAAIAVALGTSLVLWNSYSRSALIAMGAVIVVILAIKFKSLVSRKLRFFIIGILIVMASSLFIFKDSYVVSNVILHQNPESTVVSKSNEGHIDSIQSGVSSVLSKPFGTGVGSVGSASLLDSNPNIIENQYLYVAHEVGWLGLFLFAIIFIGVMTRLWNKRQDWLALGLFASGIGLAIIGILLPVWADDTVSIIWWGLAGLTIGGMIYGKSINKKTA